MTPNLYYQLFPYHIYIPLYKTTILGWLVLLTGKSIEHYEFAFQGIKSIVNEYTLVGQDYQPQKYMIDKEAAIISDIKLNWVIESVVKDWSNMIQRQLDMGIPVFDDVTKEMVIKDITDWVCERQTSGVRFQGKETIKQLVLEYLTKTNNKYYNMSKDENMR